MLDNGPEMAAAFLGIGSAATAAPLNPSYRAEEFEFYLTDLSAKLLVVAQGKDSPAIAVAREARRSDRATRAARPSTARAASRLDFAGDNGAPARTPRAATPDDIALVLHTSGTTSRPKIVPLAHKNIAASAANIRKTLALTANDRGLVIMPLFHIHGLIAALLGAALGRRRGVLLAGLQRAQVLLAGSTRCSPTWYTGVPTMHQAILLARREQSGRSSRITGCASSGRRRPRCRRR